MIAILGGGLSGLTAAYRLSKTEKVILIEKEENLGGLATSFEKDNDFFPITYHHVMTRDNPLLNLIRELDLEHELCEKKTKIGFFWQNKVYPLSGPLDLLFFKPLDFISKIRLCLFGLRIMFVKDWAKYDNVNAKEWIIKNAGLEVYEKLFAQLLESKFTSDAGNISASWIGYRLSTRESSGQFFYMKKGINSIIDELKKRAIQNGAKIISGSEINKVKIKDNKITEISYRKNKKDYRLSPDKVISTIPIPVFFSKLEKKDKKIFNSLARVRYKSSVSCIICLNKKITSYYWTNLIEQGKNSPIFKAIFDYANLNPFVNHGGSVLYLITYLNKEDPLYNDSTDEIYRKYMKDLKQIFPDIDKHIKWHKIFKLPYSKPVYYPGYRNFRPKMGTPIKNLYFSGICLFPKMRNMGAAIESGVKVSELVNKK